MSTTVEPEKISESSPPAPRLIILGQCDVSVWGMTTEERHRRAFRRATASRAGSMGGGTVIIRADYILGEDLVHRLAKSEGVILGIPGDNSAGMIAVAAHASPQTEADVRAIVSHEAICDGDRIPDGMRVLSPSELGSAYNRPLRKRAAPLVLSASNTPVHDIERVTFDAVYKGATDFVTKWVWPVPARWATRWAAARKITPNAVTTLSLGLVVLAALLFAQGHFLVGVAVAWAMTFLDTVDGKLARVTLTSSRWGNVYDHGIDLIHPPFWWWAWWHGLKDGSIQGMTLELEWALGIIIIGYVVGRLMEGVFKLLFGIETHIWRPVDSYFRTITARRNPNLAILMFATLAGRPDLGFLAVAGWTIFSLIFHAARIFAAAWVRAFDGEIRSWMNEPN